LSVRAANSTWDTAVSDLRREIDKKNGSIVLIRADKSVPYRTIQRLIAVAKSAGAAQIALATEPVKK
jgi:biopolymer transport protein ExbD